MTTGVIRTGNATSLGAATTKTEISPAAGLFMPADAKMLLAIKPLQINTTITAAQSVSAQLDVESGDVRVMPYQVLFPPIGSTLSVGVPVFEGMELWNMNVPLSGGEAFHVYGTPLVTNTTAPLAQAWLVVSNNPRDYMGGAGVLPQFHAKIGTLTATGTTTNTDVAGTKYSFSGAQQITELFGEYHPKTITTGDAVIGEIKFVSSEFVDTIPQTLPLYAMSVGLGASLSMMIPSVSRQKVAIPVKPGQVNIQDYLNVGAITATAGSFIDGVLYV